MTPQPTPETSPRLYSVTKSGAYCFVQLDSALIQQLQCDAVKINILDSVNFKKAELEIVYIGGDETYNEITESATCEINNEEINTAEIQFFNSSGTAADCAVLSVEYLKGGAVVGSSLVQYADCELKLLKYKVTLPVANSTVQVWKPSDGDIAAFVWEAGLPIVRESCYLLADSENYLEGMSGEVSIPSTVQSVLIESQEDYELVLWFAQMKIKLTNGTIIDAKPFNGSGGGVVEKLPQ